MSIYVNFNLNMVFMCCLRESMKVDKIGDFLKTAFTLILSKMTEKTQIFCFWKCTHDRDTFICDELQQLNLTFASRKTLVATFMSSVCICVLQLSALNQVLPLQIYESQWISLLQLFGHVFMCTLVLCLTFCHHIIHWLCFHVSNPWIPV